MSFATDYLVPTLGIATHGEENGNKLMIMMSDIIYIIIIDDP